MSPKSRTVPSSDFRSHDHAHPVTQSAWSNVHLNAEQVEKLVDRLSLALGAQSDLESARAQLATRQVEREIAREKAERATETLSTFLHALGHDLRAPFVALDANLQLLKMLGPSRSGAEVESCMSEMRRTCDHGLALVHDLFELIRSDAGQWRVEPRPIVIGALLGDICAMALAQARAKGLSIELRWGIDPSDWVETDPTRLGQALGNLLLNAIKFSDQGLIVVEITRNSSELLHISVSDEGAGIEPEFLDHLFEPFKQGKAGQTGSTSGSAPHAGAGLGLAIVRRCARLLGGDVSVTNRLPHGAVFALQVPAPRRSNPGSDLGSDQEPEPNPDTNLGQACIGDRCAIQNPIRDRHALVTGVQSRTQQPSGSNSASDSASNSGQACIGSNSGQACIGGTPALRALIVDDSRDAARLLAHHLHVAGVATTIAHSLAEARSRLTVDQIDAPSPFDFVIADLQLSDGSGLAIFEVTDLPIRFTSATPISELPNAAKPGFLAKPISAETVRAFVIAAVESIRAART